MNLLVKMFVKDSDEVEKASVRTAYGILASVVGIICNIFLFFIKLLIGVMIQSISVMADAFNNLSDAASSIISFIGVKLANRPADKEHPFGHGRYEYIASFVVSFLILQVGITCFKSSITKIINPQTILVRPILIVILCLSVGVKIWLALFNRKLGKKINSNVMKATAADSIGDVLITSATIISIIIGYVTELNIDGFMGIAVSIFVFISGINIARETLEPLLGEAIDKELYQKITKKVCSYKYIMGCHDLVVHNYGPTHTMATIHCEVPNNIPMEDAHEVIDQIERDVLREDNIFLVIHMDPVEVNNEKVVLLKEKVTSIVKILEKEATIHDFRVVNGDCHSNLIFDLVIPHNYSEKQEKELERLVTQLIKEWDPKYECVISLDHSYVAEK
ncbi:cation diffusion facilitator family transporter [Clostridium sp. Marseille-P299]|uniref:cation diffusion facilitator family transporter n=1 Tax=Clostridium sp. Marseille-P299 TaxID=1805477 RepID=UPI000835A50E|nr:cation diffusion facilitator family transporter [Clostridium sp. Marseille-P299]